MRVYIISRATESVKLTDISMTEINRASHAMFSFFLLMAFDSLTKVIQVIERGHERTRKEKTSLVFRSG